MKNKFAILALSFSLLTSKAFADSVVATYKGGEVKESQVVEQFKKALESQNKKFTDLDYNDQEGLIRIYVNGKLLDQKVKSSGVESSKSFQEKLAIVKDELLKKELVESKIDPMVTDAAIDAEYNKETESLKGKKEARIYHILVNSEEKAKEVKKQLSKTGVKFADIAKKFSEDPNTKSVGGEIGYVSQANLVPEFGSKVFALKMNEISEPIKTQFGWHVAYKDDERPIKIPAKDDVRNAIAGKLRQEAAAKYLGDLNSEADVKITLPKPAAEVSKAEKSKDAVTSEKGSDKEEKSKAAVKADKK